MPYDKRDVLTGSRIPFPGETAEEARQTELRETVCRLLDADAPTAYAIYRAHVEAPRNDPATLLVEVDDTGQPLGFGDLAELNIWSAECVGAILLDGERQPELPERDDNSRALEDIAANASGWYDNPHPFATHHPTGPCDGSPGKPGTVGVMGPDQNGLAQCPGCENCNPTKEDK